MQVRNVALAGLVVCLLSSAALAQEAMRVSPTSFTPADEAFLNIYVSGLSTTDIIEVRFEGPGGIATIEPSYVDADQLIVWVPQICMTVEGQYQVDVYVTRATTQLHYGPGFFRVELPDEELPEFGLYLPEVIIGEAASIQGGTVEFEVVSTDGTPVQCTPASGAFFPYGMSIVQCSATNAANQTASGSFAVFVIDTVSPNIYVPEDFSTDNPVVTWTVTADDNIDSSPDIFCSPASGSTFKSGTTHVVCFAIDQNLNYAYGEFNVHVTGGAPELFMPDLVYAEATSAAGAIATYTVTASENGVVNCSPASGSHFAFGQTDVQCSATNAAGTTTGSFPVYVDDTTGPVLVLPDLTVEATSNSGAQVTFAPTATDIVDGTVPVVCTPPSGSTFPIGETTVLCTAIDARNNMSEDSFVVTVLDATPPVITSVTANPNALWPPDHKMYPVTVTVVATDNIDPSPVSQIVSVSSNQPVNGTGDGDMAPDWQITGPLTLNLRSERSGNQDRIYTITVKCTDATGNSSTATVQVRVTQTRRSSNGF